MVKNYEVELGKIEVREKQMSLNLYPKNYEIVHSFQANMDT